MFPQRHIGKSLISIAAIHTQQQRQKCSIIVCQTAHDRYINGQKQKSMKSSITGKSLCWKVHIEMDLNMN